MAAPASEPGLESLDDLLQKDRVQSSQAQHNGGSSTPTLSADDHNSSSTTITSPKPPVRDETRWNGFHLWRTESQSLQASRDRAQAESRQQQDRSNWVHSIGHLARGWYAGGAATEPRSVEQVSEDRMTWLHMFLLTVVSAGGQVSRKLLFSAD